MKITTIGTGRCLHTGFRGDLQLSTTLLGKIFELKCLNCGIRYGHHNGFRCPEGESMFRMTPCIISAEIDSTTTDCMVIYTEDGHQHKAFRVEDLPTMSDEVVRAVAELER